MTQLIQRRLFLVRHGHRDTTNYRDDNGLSDKGISQLQGLASFFSEYLEDTKEIAFSCSPKKRCIESLQIIATGFSKKIFVEEKLIEQQDDEDSKKFEGRIKDWLNDWKKEETPISIICSHGDWIPLFMKISMDLHIDVKKSGWLELNYTPSSDSWVLEKMSS